MNDEALRALADRLEIHDVLMRYCRGIDRGDPELLRTVFHDHALPWPGGYAVFIGSCTSTAAASRAVRGLRR